MVVGALALQLLRAIPSHPTGTSVRIAAYVLFAIYFVLRGRRKLRVLPMVGIVLCLLIVLFSAATGVFLLLPVRPGTPLHSGIQLALLIGLVATFVRDLSD